MKSKTDVTPSFEDKKRAEFKRLMEYKWLHRVPTKWLLDIETMQEALDFLSLAMAEARHEEKTYLLENYDIRKK